MSSSRTPTLSHLSCAWRSALGVSHIVTPHGIARWLGPALAVFAVVLGVTQVALGLQAILHNLSMTGVFTEQAS
jgi:type III secretory pathway component EscR